MSDDEAVYLFFDGLDLPPAARGELGARLRRILERERATADNLRTQLAQAKDATRAADARLGASERNRKEAEVNHRAELARCQAEQDSLWYALADHQEWIDATIAAHNTGGMLRPLTFARIAAELRARAGLNEGETQ